MNAVWIGLQTDWSATASADDTTPGYFPVIDTLFCLLFTSELVIRIVAEGKVFFSKRSPNWKWNIFDTVLVALQILEEFMARLIDEKDGQSAKFSYMRILRLLRLIRVMRLVRIVRLVSELKTIISSIMGSLRSLMWTLVLLILFIYIVGIFLTQA